MEATFVIIGGGIAGVSCAEMLAFLEPNVSIILISESTLIKTVTNLYALTKMLINFDVQETEGTSLSKKFSNIKVIHDTVIDLLNEVNTIKTKSNLLIKYKFLCICTGAQVKLIPQANNFTEIIGIRDTDSVEKLINKLQTSKKLVIVGNGGIASELVYKIQNIEIDWVVKDNHIASTFVDPGAAEFFQTSLHKDTKPQEPIVKRMRYNEEGFKRSGAALGPDWYKNLNISGNKIGSLNTLNIHYESEVQEISKSTEFPLKVELTNGKFIFCDVVISATGVTPKNYDFMKKFDLSEDGFINVNEFMQTSIKNVYAAGDICNANWNKAKHWFQMKLWTQARQMGCYAAKSMFGHLKNEAILQDFCFEMFTHSTKLFGYKVILLGLYNGQTLGTSYEILLRMTKEHEYVKFVLENNKLQGAVLIGDTDMEEMCENLILNQLDLSPFGDEILNPNVDIEDYFD